MKIQNFDTLFLQVDTDTTEVFLPKDRFLEGRKVTDIFVFNKTDILTAPNGITLINDSDLNSAYIDMYEKGKNIFVRNCPVSNFFKTIQNRTKIDRELDLDLTRIKLTKSSVANGYICLGVVYAVESEQYVQTPSNNVAIEIDSNSVYKLSEIGGYQLNGKFIKEINTIDSCNSFISIRTKDGIQLNDMPLSMFDQHKTEYDIKFDNIEIDADRSYITSFYTAKQTIIFNY